MNCQKTGDCKARNETEMKRNETGRNERKRNETEQRYILNVQMLLEYCYMENGHRKLTTGILANENIIQAQSKMKL
jgi:hypothetical protein